MFQLLLESNATPRPPVGGTVISALGHALLVGGLVAVTAEVGERVSTPPEPRARFIPVTPAPPPAPISRPRASSSSASASTPAALGTPAFPTIVEIRVGIPPIDLARATSDPGDFAASRVGRPDGVADGVGNGGGGLSVWQEDQVEKPVLLLPGAKAPPYPEMLRSAGLSGTVMLEFVVDTVGRVEPGSVHVVGSDHELFARAALGAVPGYRFLPAQAGGHRVRQLVRLPFRFSVNE